MAHVTLTTAAVHRKTLVRLDVHPQGHVCLTYFPVWEQHAVVGSARRRPNTAWTSTGRAAATAVLDMALLRQCLTGDAVRNAATWEMEMWTPFVNRIVCHVVNPRWVALCCNGGSLIKKGWGLSADTITGNPISVTTGKPCLRRSVFLCVSVFYIGEYSTQLKHTRISNKCRYP